MDKDKAVEGYESYTEVDYNPVVLYTWTRGSKYHLWVPPETLDQFLACGPGHLQKSSIVRVGT